MEAPSRPDLGQRFSAGAWGGGHLRSEMTDCEEMTPFHLCYIQRQSGACRDVSLLDAEESDFYHLLVTLM